MTTRGDTISEIAHRLGDRTDLNARILKNMDWCQQFICERLPILPWFLITENLYADTVFNEEKMNLPEGFLRETENGGVWRQRTPTSDDPRPWVLLEKRPADVLRAALGDELDATGAPTHYAIMGEFWIFYPTPDAVYRIYTRCFEKDTLPSALSNDDSTNQWLTHEAELLTSEVVLRMGRHLQYPSSIMSEFSRDRDDARRNFFTFHEARDHANMHYRMGIARGN